MGTLHFVLMNNEIEEGLRRLTMIASTVIFIVDAEDPPAK